MTKRKKNDEEDDEKDDPFDFFKYFANPKKIPPEMNKFFADPKNIFNSDQFRHLFKEIFEKMSKNLPPELQGLSPEDIMKEFTKNKSKFFKGPFMYGFNVNIGKDGKPTIDSFGNIKQKPYSGEPVVKSKREPLVEVSEETDHIVIIAEMPGEEQDDIELKATNHSLTISTKKNANRHYYKEVELSSTINSDVAKARYVNGILEVRLKIIDETHKNIKIE